MDGSRERRRANQAKGKRKKKKKLVVGQDGRTTTTATTTTTSATPTPKGATGSSATAAAAASSSQAASTPALSSSKQGGASSGRRASSSKKQRPKKPNQLLSFNEEEEADTHFVIKKDRSRNKGAHLPTDQPISAATPAFSSTYTPEDLKKLRANQSFTPGSFRGQDMDTSGMEGEEPGKANGSFIQGAPPTYGTAGLDPNMAPEDMANFARQRRKMMRDQEEYIPLEGDDQDLVPKPERRTRGAHQRLVREEDDDDVDMAATGGAPGRSTLSFDAAARGVSRKDRLKQMQKAFFAPEGGSADEEVRRWEQDALKRAATTNVVSGVDERGKARTGAGQRPGYYAGMGPDAQIPTDTERPDVSVEALHKKLGERLSVARERAAQHTQHRQRLDADLKQLRERLPKEEEELKSACSRYNFLKEMKIYIKNLVECLDEKASAIEGLESDMHAHLKSVADRIKERFKQDCQDRGEAIVHNLLRLPQDQQERIARRKARKEAAAARRRQAAGAENAGGGGDDEDDAAWSDTELDADDKAQEEEERALIVQKAAAVLSDVNDDFSHIPKIAERFENWKLSFPESYESAFASTSFKMILQPLISLQLISWNPLDPGSPDFEGMEWFTDLVLYGCDKTTHAQDENDPDAYLIPELIDMILVPKLAGFLEFIYDPLSSTQTNTAVAVVERLTHDFHIDFSTENGKKLVAGLTSCLRHSASSLPPMFAPPQDALPSAETQRFQHQIAAYIVKFVRNVLAWQHVISEDALHEIVLESVVCKSVLAAMNTCGSEQISIALLCQVVQTLPKEWFSDSHKSRNAIKRIVEPFAAFLTQFGRRLSSPQDIGTVIGALGTLGEEKKASRLHGFLASKQT